METRRVACAEASNIVGVSTGLSVPERGSRFYYQSCLARSNEGPSGIANETRPTGRPGHREVVGRLVPAQGRPGPGQH